MVIEYILFDEDGEIETNESQNEILEILNENIQTLNENVQILNETLTSEEEVTEEEVTEEEITEAETIDSSLVFADTTVDSHLYLSSEVDGATLNDIYSIGLSIRNLLLVFLLFYAGLRCIGALKNALYHIMNK